MSFGKDINRVYDARYSNARLSAAGGWTELWKNWGSCVVVFCYKEATYVNMPFIRCIEWDVHANRREQVVRRISGLLDNTPITQSLEYRMFSRPYHTPLPLNNFEYWLKDIYFEPRFHVWHNVALCISWQYINIYGISTQKREEPSIQVLSPRTGY